jgi:redox-sensing transcriptional repressor
VDLRKVDLSIELQILAFHEQRKSADGHKPRGARTVRRALREDPVNPEPDAELAQGSVRRPAEPPIRQRSATDLNEVLPA